MKASQIKFDENIAQHQSVDIHALCRVQTSGIKTGKEGFGFLLKVFA